MAKVEMVYFVDNKLIKEIEENQDYKEGTKYSIDYFSMDFDLLEELEDKILIYGFEFFYFYCYLKKEMCKLGKYYFLSSRKEIIFKKFSSFYDVSLEKLEEMFQDLLLQRLIFIVDTEKLGEIITDPYIIYNYRLTMEKRAYNRKLKQKERDNKKQVKTSSEPIPAEALDPAPSAPNFKVDDDNFEW